MKTLKIKTSIATFALFTITLITSCNKNDDTVVTPLPVANAPEQNPFQEFLTTTGLNQVTQVNLNGTSGERGFSFIPQVNGKLTAIILKLPAAQTNSVRVTIWDKQLGTIIETENVNYTVADVELVRPITPINLTSGREYVVCSQTDDYYKREKTNPSNVNYPIIVGDIKITNFYGIAGTSQVIPTFPYLQNIFGDCSFKFQKN